MCLLLFLTLAPPCLAAFTVTVPPAPPGTATYFGLFSRSTNNLMRQVWADSSTSTTHTFDQALEAHLLPPATVLRAFRGAAPNFTWSGLVGTTGQQTGMHVWNGLNAVEDFTIAGGRAFMTRAYAELDRALYALDLSDTTRPLSLGHSDYHRLFSLVATDGEIVYYANSGLVVPPSSFFYEPTTFVIGYDLSPGDPPFCEHNFTLGGRPDCESGTGQANCTVQWDGCNGYGGYFSSVMDYAHNETGPDGGHFPDAPSGLAVQISPGSVLAVAHGQRNSSNLRLFDKKSGALLCAYTLDSPASLAFDPQGRLWVVEGGGVNRYVLPPSCGGGAPTLTPELALGPSRVGAAPGALAVGGHTGRLFVVDTVTSQVRVFEGEGGAPLTPIGTPGGYSDGNTTVTTDKLWLLPTRRGGFVALDDDPGEGLWVNDFGNRRILHLDSTTGAELTGSVAYLTVFYRSTVHPLQPSRAFANFLEFSVDYAPTPPAWSLVRNWGAGLPPSYTALDYDSGINRWGWAGFNAMGAALGFTVATVDYWPNASSTSQYLSMAVLLDEATGLLTPLQNFSSSHPWQVVPVLHTDGAMRYTVDHPGWQEVWEMPLQQSTPTSLPGWVIPGRRIASFNFSTPGNASASFAARDGGVPPRFPLATTTTVGADGTSTSTTLVILLDASKGENGGAHLGAVPVNGTALAWTASPWGSWDLTHREGVVGGVNCTLYTVENPRGVFGAANPGTNYAAGYSAVLEGALIYNFFGEGWMGWEANQFVVFSTTGLFIGQCECVGLGALALPRLPILTTTPLCRAFVLVHSFFFTPAPTFSYSHPTHTCMHARTLTHPYCPPLPCISCSWHPQFPHVE
jgi:hypothetical protein